MRNRCRVIISPGGGCTDWTTGEDCNQLGNIVDDNGRSGDTVSYHIDRRLVVSVCVLCIAGACPEGRGGGGAQPCSAPPVFDHMKAPRSSRSV